MKLPPLPSATELRARFGNGARHGLLSVLAASIAYLPMHALGVHEGFWSAITALAVAQTQLSLSESTARNQLIGGVAGGVVALAMLVLFGMQLPVYLAAVLLAVCACWLFNVPSASQLSGITVTIIMLVPNMGTPEQVFLSRLSEVIWGICAGFSVVWSASRLSGWKG
jgi:uncharacterized membrane protein YccC